MRLRVIGSQTRDPQARVVTCSGAVTVFGKWVKAEETMLSQARKAETPSLNIVPQIEGYQAKSPLCRFYELWPKIEKTVF